VTGKDTVSRQEFPSALLLGQLLLGRSHLHLGETGVNPV
jgi:hypothetical protein